MFRPILIVSLIVSFVCISAPAVAGNSIEAEIRTRLDAAGASPAVPGLAVKAADLREFYKARSYRPAWIAGNQVREALAVLGGADAEGLDPADYGVREIAARMTPRSAQQRAALDVMLSAALAAYGADLKTGRVTPAVSEDASYAPKTVPDAAALLAGARDAPRLGAYFSGLAPRTPVYRRLRNALARYREIAGLGGWPAVPGGPNLRPGARDDRVGVLRRRLMVTGELDTKAGRGRVFDGALEEAVRRFQHRHGLAADGVVGPKTLVALNVPLEHRIDQMRLNLERRRWMPADLGRRYVFVNTADFVVKVVDGEKTVMDMRVVVGTPYRRTPVFSATMTYLEFNPYWNIPPRIAREEIVPRARHDPAYLARQGIRVFSDAGKQATELASADVTRVSNTKGRFPYRLRQDPGPNNPLGRVKFMFPNNFDVYLHDTPSRRLFDQDIRTFSHGCIRVEKPVALAEYLLRDSGSWSEREVLGAMETGQRRVVRLARPIAVHITYLTAWVNKDGSVHFRRDIYGRDGRLAMMLLKGSRRPGG